MAKTISDEQMKLSIIINGNEAQKELFNLEKSTRSLNEQNKSLLLQKNLLEKQGKKETAEYRLLTATIKQNTAEITSNKNRMSELQKEIGLTGLTMSQLQSKATMLRNTLRNLVPGSDDFNRYQAELTAVNTRLGELSGRSRTAQSSIGSLADSFNRYQGMALAVIATLTGVVLSIQKIIDYNGKLADAQADVMKTTRMTKEEVDELTKSFGLLKTRTQRIDLLGIAKVAGELNIAKAEVGDFVKVMDKAGVSLGDSFEGGAEEVATKLGKIKTLYDELKEAKVELAFESVGSALNDLGADGNATAANISDFVTRVGTLSAGLKPTISEALGLGAAFEETGLNAEIAGNNYGKLLRIAARDTPKFAQFMRMTNEEATKLINTDPTEFFLKFTKAFGNIKDATAQASLLDSLKLNDNEVGMVISAAAKNSDLFRQKIELANNSLNDATSLTSEFNIKNTNLAATLEKIKKTTTGWFSSDSFVKWLTSAVSWLAKLIGASDDADGSAQRLRDRFIFMVKIIAIVITSYISYNAAVKLTALWTNGLATATQILTAIQNRGAIVTGILRSAQLLLAASYYTITGNTVRATAAMRLFNASASANPLGLVLLTITAVVAALVLFNKETSKATKVQQMQADIQNEVAKSIAKEKNEVEALVRIINDETVSKDKKLAAIKRLNEISPEHLKGLTLENIKTLEGKKLLDAYTESLYKKARAQAVTNKIQQLEDEKLDLESKTAGDFRKEQTFGFLGSRQFDKFKTKGDFEKYVKSTYGGLSKAKQDEIVNKFIAASGMEDKLASIKDLDAQINALKPEFEKNLMDSLVTKVTPGDTSVIIPDDNSGATKTNPNSSLAEINKLKLDEQSKYNEQSLKLTRQIEDDKIAAMLEGYNKELAIENLRYQREIEDLDRQKIHADELAKIDEDISKAKESKDLTKYNALLTIRKGWDAKNIELDAKIQSVKEGKLAIHNLKLATIEEKAAKDSIEKSKKAFDEAKILRETKFNEEYAALGNNEKAKEHLKKQFDANELEQETIFLNELIQKFNTIVGKGKLEGIDLSLLSPEQVATFTAEAAKVGLTLSELIKKKNELAGKSEGTDFGILQGQGTDIFGFSPEQWDSAFSNFETMEEKIGAVSTVLGGLQNAWSMYSSFVESNSRKELQNLDKKQTTERTKLKRQLDSKHISQAQYDKKIKKLDDEKEKAQAEADYKRAKNERIGALFSIATNTSIGIMKAVAASPLTGGMPWTAIIGGLGLLQAALVLKNPLPAKGHEEGLYPEYVKRSQDGKVFKSKYQGKTRSGLVSDTSHFLVAENGPEMVIDAKAWRQMNPAVKDSLIRELNGIKGFEQGLYNQQTQRIEVPAQSTTPGTTDTQMMQMMMALVAENTATMKELKDKVFLGVMTNKDLKSMGYLKEGIQAYEDLRNKSKR